MIPSSVKGIRMSRRKGDGEGTLRVKTVAGKKVYWARWIEWGPDGKRKRPEKILGLVSEIGSKANARDLLNQHIRETTGKVEPMPTSPTFADIWQRFVTVKTPMWSRANRKTLTSIFDRAILPAIGYREFAALTPEPLQAAINHMAEIRVGKGERQRIGYGESAIKKAVRYISALYEFAIDEGIAQRNLARRLQIPITRETCERYLSIDEVRRLIGAAEGRERIILGLFILGGLRPAEVFALRGDDILGGELRIDQAVVDAECGARRIGRTKTRGSKASIAIPEALESDLRAWAAGHSPTSLLFPTGNGTPWRIGNYLKRVMKPLAESVGITDLTHQCLRRTFATHFQRHGTLKDTQTQMRHTRAETTMEHYQKTLPDSLRGAVESWASEVAKKVQ